MTNEIVPMSHEEETTVNIAARWGIYGDNENRIKSLMQDYYSGKMSLYQVVNLCELIKQHHEEQQQLIKDAEETSNCPSIKSWVVRILVSILVLLIILGFLLRVF
jgi:hypothetical protein